MRTTGLLAIGILTAVIAGCGSSGGSKPRLGINEELALKRAILIEHGNDLTAEQQFVIANSRFESEEEAIDLVDDFLQFNEDKAALENPENPRSASDVVLRNADDE